MSIDRLLGVGLVFGVLADLWFVSTVSLSLSSELDWAPFGVMAFIMAHVMTTGLVVASIYRDRIR